MLSIFLLRPVAIKYLHQSKDKRVSNAEALIGREGKVTDTIEAGGYGRVKIDGDSWKAQSVDGSDDYAGSIEYVSYALTLLSQWLSVVKQTPSCTRELNQVLT